MSQEFSRESTEHASTSKTRRTLMVVAALLIAAVSAAHYVTDTQDVTFHNVFRRLYYIPIVLAAFAYGMRGGIAAALLSSAAYVPHAFLLTHHADPAPAIDKVLEIVLYIAIGGLAGWLHGREEQTQRKLSRSLRERAELEEQLVRAEKLSALGHLTAGLAHEIRNPLAAIQGSAETLASEFDETHRKRRMADLLLQEISRLDKVVSDFLTFARPHEPRRKDVDLSSVAKHVVELLHSEAEQRGVELIVTGEEHLLAAADSSQLEQLLINLVLNAFEATKETERPRVRLNVCDRSVGGRTFACIAVGDNGTGIAPEHRDAIFDPYFTTRDDGTGLGLSISSRILEAHGGFLDVETTPAGTTMWSCLPLRTEPA